MVDDFSVVSNVEKTERMNQVINTFIEKKKLKLSQSKSYRIHIGKGHNNCQPLKIQESEMKVSEREKYLGDIFDKSGSLQATIDSRKLKGQASFLKFFKF